MLKDDHRRDRFNPLRMGYVEAFHALRQARQVEDAGQGFDGSAGLVCIVLPLEAALFEENAGVILGHGQQLLLDTPLRDD